MLKWPHKSNAKTGHTKATDQNKSRAQNHPQSEIDAINWQQVYQTIRTSKQNPNTLTHLQMPILFTAIAQSNIPAIENLLHLGCNPNITHQNPSATPLIFATGLNNMQAAQLLTEYGANVSQGAEHKTPILLAIAKGNNAIGKWLISKGCKLNDVYNLRIINSSMLSISQEGTWQNQLTKLVGNATSLSNLKLQHVHNPLMASIAYNNKEMMQELIKAGANINITDPQGRCPLLRAVKANEANLVKQLIALGANPQQTMLDGWTILMESAMNGFYEITKIIAPYVNPNATTVRGKTALMLAVIRGDINTARLLIQYGARLNAKMEYGSNIISIAAINNTLNIAHLLLESGANPNEANEGGYTPLMFATQNGSKEMTDLLLQYGANPNLASKKGELALHFAAESSSQETLTQIIQVTQNINQQDDHGNTPLMKAIQKRKEENAKILLQAGANPNINNAKPSTPIVEATKVASPRIVQYLLQAGANPSARDESGRTLSEIAIALHDKETFEIVDPLSPTDTIVKVDQEEMERQIESL